MAQVEGVLGVFAHLDAAVEAVEKILDDFALDRIVEEGCALARAAGLGHVPIEHAGGTRMAEALQRAREAPQHIAEAGKQGRRFVTLGEGLAGQVIDDAHEMRPSIIALALAQDLGGMGQFQMRLGQGRIVLRVLAQQARLEVQRLQILGLVGDLHHPALPARFRQVEILIALAVERRDLRGDRQ